jgi:DNA mismatch endonuclease (patch repair protein)
MADVFTKEQRSHLMRQVKSSRNKSTEIKLIGFFKVNKFSGWRRNYKIFGRPDFVFPKSKKAIFVDGCFWHGHNCRNTQPKDNKDYWITKIKRNKQRDKKVNKHLTQLGWIVIRLWECELKDLKKLIKKINYNGA